MSSVAVWDEELQNELGNLTTTVSQTASASGARAKQLLQECDAIISRIKDAKKSFGLEIKMVRDKSVKAGYDSKLKFYDEEFNTLQNQVKSTRQQLERNELMPTGAGAGGSSAATHSYFQIEGKDNDDLLNDAMHLQDQTMSSLGRTRGLIEASKEVGTATLEELRKQREQIKDIDHEVTVIDSNLKRARILVTNFSKRLAGDRIIQCFTAVNIIILAVVIIYVILTGKTLSNNSSSNPDNPSDDGEDGAAVDEERAVRLLRGAADFVAAAVARR